MAFLGGTRDCLLLLILMDEGKTRLASSVNLTCSRYLCRTNGAQKDSK